MSLLGSMPLAPWQMHHDPVGVLCLRPWQALTASTCSCSWCRQGWADFLMACRLHTHQCFAPCMLPCATKPLQRICPIGVLVVTLCCGGMQRTWMNPCQTSLAEVSPPPRRCWWCLGSKRPMPGSSRTSEVGMAAAATQRILVVQAGVVRCAGTALEWRAVLVNSYHPFVERVELKTIGLLFLYSSSTCMSSQ